MSDPAKFEDTSNERVPGMRASTTGNSKRTKSGFWLRLVRRAEHAVHPDAAADEHAATYAEWFAHYAHDDGIAGPCTAHAHAPRRNWTRASSNDCKSAAWNDRKPVADNARARTDDEY